MSERDVENFENEGGASPPVKEGGQGEGSASAERQPAPSGDEFRVSKEDWEKQQQAIVTMANALQQLYEAPEWEEEAEEEPLDPRIAKQIETTFRGVLGPYAPVIETMREKQGDELLTAELKKFQGEGKGKVGDFDMDLAKRTAFYFSRLDPENPERAVAEAAKYAADIRRAERTAGQEDLKRKLGRGGYDDFAVEGSATAGSPRAQTYDEVIERWQHTDPL